MPTIQPLTLQQTRQVIAADKAAAASTAAARNATNQAAASSGFPRLADAPLPGFLSAADIGKQLSK